MVVHQDEGMELDAVALRQLRHQAQEPPPVRVVEKHRSTPVPAVHHMIPGVRPHDAYWSGHGHPLASAPKIVNC